MIKKHCGRIDQHDGHEWRLPKVAWVNPRFRTMYWCPGPPVHSRAEDRAI